MAVPWQTFIARFRASDIEGAPASCYVTAEIETPLVWAATGQVVLPATKSKWTQGGAADFVLPLPGQGGFTAGYGGATISSFGFKFWAQPTRSRPITPGSTTWVSISTTADSVVNIGNLVNIGAWEHATIVTGGGGSGTTTYVPVTVSGNTGYWSPA